MSGSVPSLFPGVFLRGMLMGAADIVPGVSGGTVAFITGIYQRLLAAIAAWDLALLRLLMRGAWREAWLRVDAPFVLSLMSGILVSVVSLARVIGYALIAYPLLVWSFFFGLIVASAVVLLRHVRHWSLASVVGLLCGTVFAAWVGFAPALNLEAGPVSFFLAGFVAICAMILPGVSGSFILVLLGMYPAVLGALRVFDAAALGLLAAGAICGLLSFTRLLKSLLGRFPSQTMATLTGFLFGSLPVVWPWKLAADSMSLPRPVLPPSYGAAYGDSQIVLCLALMVGGGALVWLLEYRWGGLER